jgi:hypothetical protein
MTISHEGHLPVTGKVSSEGKITINYDIKDNLKRKSMEVVDENSKELNYNTDLYQGSTLS